MKDLLIIGAGGCGREVLQWVKDINEVQPVWNIKGFLDDNLNALNGMESDYIIISTVKDYVVEKNDVFTCPIGNSKIRKKIVRRIQSKGGEFVSIIHPTAIIADTVKLGRAEIIYPYTVISDNVKMGDGCIINMHSSIGHNSVLGEYCTISAHCDVTGGCNVSDNVFMGSGARIIPGLNVGEGAFICAGSAVMINIKSGMKVIGIPARKAGF